MSKERFKLQLMLKHRLISSLTFKFEEKKLIFKRESVRKSVMKIFMELNLLINLLILEIVSPIHNIFFSNALLFVQIITMTSLRKVLFGIIQKRRNHTHINITFSKAETKFSAVGLSGDLVEICF